MIKLGEKVKDEVTGLIGIAVAQCIYLNSCVSFEVQPRLDKDGKWTKSKWVDESQLIIIEEPEPKIERPEPKPERMKLWAGGGGPGDRPDKKHPPGLYDEDEE